MPLVAAVDDRPRRVRHVGLLDQPLGDVDEVVVPLPVAPLRLRDAPPRERVVLERPQPRALRVPIEVHPELQDRPRRRRPACARRPRSAPSGAELGARRAAVDAVDERRTVPRAQEEADLAARRQRQPVAPERRALALVLRRFVERAVDDPAWVHPLVEQVHGLALAGAVDAAEQHDEREGVWPSGPAGRSAVPSAAWRPRRRIRSWTPAASAGRFANGLRERRAALTHAPASRTPRRPRGCGVPTSR